ncbi:hypothetical protein JTL86_08230 [Pseudomonas aeruginosa]|nr:hypothetical protein [Pseudomonas aeruginosa]
MKIRERLSQAYIDYVLGFAFYKETKDSSELLKFIVYPIYAIIQIPIALTISALLVFLIAMLTSMAIMPYENAIVGFLTYTIGADNFLAHQLRTLIIASATCVLFAMLEIISWKILYQQNIITTKEAHDKN